MSSSSAVKPFGQVIGTTSLTRIWMDNVVCNGKEAKLELCDFAGIGVTNCDHTEDATVTCLSDDCK